jgi:hypothetical protein
MEHQGRSATWAGISVRLGVTPSVLRLWIRASRPRTLLSRTALCLSGYLRPRPDKALEYALRTAFTRLDEELALVLDDRPTLRPRL